MKKYLAYFLPVMVVGGTLLAGVAIVGAQTADGSYPSIIQKLANRFNLNPDEVKTVFDENRQEIQSKAEENFQNSLDQMVTDGKITQDQENSILQKRDELQNLKEKLKDFTPEERQAKIQTLKDDIKQWAEDNNLNPGLIMGFRGGFSHHGMMMGMGMGIGAGYHDCPFHDDAAEEEGSE